MQAAALGAWRRAAAFPLEPLYSWERPKECGLFISSETTLNGYLITVLKYLHRDYLKLESYLICQTKTLRDLIARR